jgi:FtsH-binding integral membrane protein
VAALPDWSAKALPFAAGRNAYIHHQRRTLMRELIVSTVELLAYLLTTGALALAGVFAELTSVSYFSAGNVKFAVWLGVMGVVALYGAFSLGNDELLPRLRELAA